MDYGLLCVNFRNLRVRCDSYCNFIVQRSLFLICPNLHVSIQWLNVQTFWSLFLCVFTSPFNSEMNRWRKQHIRICCPTYHLFQRKLRNLLDIHTLWNHWWGPQGSWSELHKLEMAATCSLTSERGKTDGLSCPKINSLGFYTALVSKAACSLDLTIYKNNSYKLHLWFQFLSEETSSIHASFLEPWWWVESLWSACEPASGADRTTHLCNSTYRVCTL